MERVICKWWKLTHNRLPLRYHGTHSLVTYECTRSFWCKHNCVDASKGGCLLGGDLTDTPEEDKP